METLAAVSFASQGLMKDQMVVKEEGAFTIASWAILYGRVGLVSGGKRDRKRERNG